MALSIGSGGTAEIVYGMLLIFVLVSPAILTMAELASVYPTAGGQYHYALIMAGTSILAPPNWSRSLSYWCGIINVLGWIAICASVAVLAPQQICAILVEYESSYEIKTWHIFLLYQACNFFFTAYNIFAMKRAAWLHDIGFVISLGGFLVIIITCVAHSPAKQSNEFVWKNFVNNSGWSSDGLAFLTGLTNPNYIYAGVDGAIHLAEECKNAAVAVPRALISTLVIGFMTSFAFVLAMVYTVSNFDAVLETPTEVPIYEIWMQATRSQTAGTAFLSILMATAFFALIGCQQTSSRLTWSLARDNAIVGSKYLERIHPHLNVPVWSLLANSFVVFVIGCLYLASTTAFNAIVATSLVLSQISYAFPAVLLLYRKRSEGYLTKERYVKLGWFGWFANSATVVMAIIVIIFYNFPTTMPVTAGNMNYTVAVLGIMVIFIIANWFGYAAKRYRGPRIEGHVARASK